MVIFPNICPACSSPNARMVIPESPEVDTFHCDLCGHEWSTPAAPPLRPIPDNVLPRRWWSRKRD